MGSTLASRKVVLHSNSIMAMAIFQAGKDRDSYIEPCTSEVWLACTIHDVTLTFAILYLEIS